jgi:DNA-binding XRE family transcriptional regulator
MTQTPELLQTYRARLGLSQSQMAARWGVSLRTYQDIEQGQRRKDDAILIGLLRDLLSCEVALDVGH